MLELLFINADGEIMELTNSLTDSRFRFKQNNQFGSRLRFKQQNNKVSLKKLA